MRPTNENKKNLEQPKETCYNCTHRLVCLLRSQVKKIPIETRRELIDSFRLQEICKQYIQEDKNKKLRDF